MNPFFMEILGFAFENPHRKCRGKSNAPWQKSRGLKLPQLQNQHTALNCGHMCAPARDAAPFSVHRVIMFFLDFLIQLQEITAMKSFWKLTSAAMGRHWSDTPDTPRPESISYVTTPLFSSQSCIQKWKTVRFYFLPYSVLLSVVLGIRSYLW